MINAKMLRVSDIDQSVIAAPLIRMNHRIQRNTPANNGLQRFLAAVRDNFSIDRAIALEDAEDFRLAARSASALAFDTTRTELSSTSTSHALNGNARSASAATRFLIFKNIRLTDWCGIAANSAVLLAVKSSAK